MTGWGWCDTFLLVDVCDGAVDLWIIWPNVRGGRDLGECQTLEI